MKIPLRNRVVLLTGAASGIGEALALELSRKGSDLALVDINGAKLEETSFTRRDGIMQRSWMGAESP